MKSCALFLGVILYLFAVAQASDCDVDGHKLNAGESYSPPGSCQEITCVGKDSLTAKTCASVGVESGCHLVPQDNSKPYPQCCPQVEC